MVYQAVSGWFTQRAWLLVGVSLLCACADDANSSEDPIAGNGGIAGSDTTGAGGSTMVSDAGVGGSSNIGGDAGQPNDGSDAGTGPFGDVGQPCEPESADTICAFQCLALADGSGICIDKCGSSGQTQCPEEFKCNTVPVEQGTAQVCLPNASCGDLDFRGTCSGSILRFCGVEGPVQIDCAAAPADSGEPLKCALVSDEIGFDCVAESFTGGCVDETENGRCDGDLRIYCGSQAVGNVVIEDCAMLGLSCLVGPDDVVTCGTAGANGCGAISFEGECDGSVLRYCRESEIVSEDCGLVGECRWESNEVGFNCAPVATAGGAFRTLGSWSYEKPAVTADGLGESSPSPVRYALVRAVRASDSIEVARGFTGEDGAFDLSFDEATDVQIEVVAIGNPLAHRVSVRNCPLADCSGIGAVYSVRSEPFTPTSELELGTVLIPREGLAGAFNIFDQFVRGADFAAANLDHAPPQHVAEWARGSGTEEGTSYFTPQGNLLYILGTVDDTDEFDDSVLFHEYGHFLESAFSRSDSPGGPHDGSPTDPRLAWGEGYGTYVGSRIAGNPLYIDTSASGATVIDLREAGIEYNADPLSIRGMTQPISELLVAELLWQIDMGIDGETPPLGSARVFDVLGQYFPSSALVDRGVEGVDLVDFLDGWFCRGHGERDLIQEIVLNKRGFPYDFATVSSCL